MISRGLTYGAIAVPYTSGWEAEEGFSLARCTYFGRLAIGQRVGPGQGKPLFGKPHMQRQREAISLGLCDICGRPLKARTKVSLSHARPQPHGAEGWAILQVEPMMHRECAALAISQCPSLKRDVEHGTLRVRQVYRWRAQAAIMSEVFVESLTGERRTALGHAKVELIEWADRDQEWLV